MTPEIRDYSIWTICEDTNRQESVYHHLNHAASIEIKLLSSLGIKNSLGHSSQRTVKKNINNTKKDVKASSIEI